MPVLKPDEVAELLRGVALRTPGSKKGLDRDTACAVLSQLQELQRRSRRAGRYVFCPYCREGFDTAHGGRSMGRPDPPPRHPDPIAASDTATGAEVASAALAKALVWRNAELVDANSYWVDLGHHVLWPLLYVARATGRTMDEVRRLVHRVHLEETLVTVSAALEALEPSPDVERVRRAWGCIVACDLRARPVGFDYAYRLVHHWDVTGHWLDDNGVVVPSRGAMRNRGQR